MEKNMYETEVNSDEELWQANTKDIESVSLKN